MGNGKIKCNLCNEEYSADACKSFTYGRLDVNICPTCLVWSSHEWAVMARKTLRQKKGRRWRGSDIYGCDNVGYHWYLLYDLF